MRFFKEVPEMANYRRLCFIESKLKYKDNI
jgi:hypothetical protein